jgi:hypothetical protein
MYREHAVWGAPLVFALHATPLLPHHLPGGVHDEQVCVGMSHLLLSPYHLTPVHPACWAVQFIGVFDPYDEQYHDTLVSSHIIYIH